MGKKEIKTEELSEKEARRNSIGGVFGVNSKIFYILLFMCIITGGVVLKMMSSVVLPAAFSILFSFVVYPLVKKLNQKFKIPWLLAIAIIFLLVFFVTYGLMNILVTSLVTIANTYPKYEERFTTIYKIIAKNFKLSYDEDLSLLTNLWNQLGVRNSITRFALDISGGVYGFLVSFMKVLLLSFFLLLEMRNTKAKLSAAFQGEKSERVKNIMRNIVVDTTRYISIKFVVSLATGIIVFLVLLTVRMEFPIVWAFFAFVMNFIPTFGSIISCALTILFSILQFYPAAFPVAIVALTMVLTNFVLGNIVEPRIVGGNLNLSPFIILLSLTLWGWMWGFIGMVIAVPIMVILKIICENVSYLKPIGILLGNM